VYISVQKDDGTTQILPPEEINVNVNVQQSSFAFDAVGEQWQH
jgi:hypothetical protein